MRYHGRKTTLKFDSRPALYAYLVGNYTQPRSNARGPQNAFLTAKVCTN